MKKKPGKVFIDRISLRVFFVRHFILSMLKQRVVVIDSVFKYKIYSALYDFYAFYSKLQIFCKFTARARGIYFKLLSRYKLKQYHGSGVLVGIKKVL
jgi:ribosomal protein S14